MRIPHCHGPNSRSLFDKTRHIDGIFGINFAICVATSVPMEFQFGTNWAAFSKAAGGVIGQTLAMEGMFSFFLESSFLGLFLFGEKRLGRMGHWLSAFLIWLDTIFYERQNLRSFGGAPSIEVPTL